MIITSPMNISSAPTGPALALAIIYSYYVITAAVFSTATAFPSPATPETSRTAAKHAVEWV